MAVQKSFTFSAKTLNQLNWTVLDQNNNVVNSAAVTTTLYWARDRINPEQTSGIAVTNFSGVSLIFNSATQQYSAVILFDAPPGGDYMLVVDVKDQSANQLEHVERPAVVIQRGF